MIRETTDLGHRFVPAPPFAITAVALTGALFIGAGVAWLGGALQVLAVLPAAALAIAAVVLTLYRFEYGLLLLPVTAAAVPLSVGTGTGSAIVASVIFSGFLVLVWLVRMMLRTDVRVASSSITLPLLAFVGAAAVSTVYSDVVRPPLVAVWPTFWQAQLGGLSMFVLSAAVLLLVLNSLRKPHWIARLTFLFIALGALDITSYVLQRRDLPGFEAGGLFSLWVVVLALGQAVFNRDLPGWARGGLSALALAWMFRRFMFENGWLTGWVPMSAGVLLLFFLRSRRYAVAALIAAAVIGLLSFQDIYAREVTGVETAPSFLLGSRPGASEGHLLRIPIWLQSLELTKDHLLLGTGPAGYAPYYITLFREFAYSSHSNYLDILAETGVVGFVLFAWFLVAIFRVGLSVRRRTLDGFGSGFVNGVLAGLVGLVIGMALGDWFIPFVYNASIAGFRYTIHSWIFLGGLAAMQRIAAASSDSTQ